MASAGNFVVDPGIGLVIWVVIAFLSIPAAVVTASKGRWGWFAFGFITGGLAWLLGSFQPARPTSLWSRRVRRRSTGTT
jgi:hypothetical protein